MSVKEESPWASGLGEILRHGLDLLKKDTDTNRRLAMIAIDNAVELTVKTYLGLPKRVTGLSIARKEFQEISESSTLPRSSPGSISGRLSRIIGCAISSTIKVTG